MDKQDIINGLNEILDVALYSCDTEYIKRFNEIISEATKVIENAN